MSLSENAFPQLATRDGLMREDDFQVRPGRIRTRGERSPRTFVGEALAAAQRAGGLQRRLGARTSIFGRGRSASVRALHGVNARARGAVVKARVVRQGGARASLATHLDYLQREGVTQAAERGQLFDAKGEAADGRTFAERCEGDRHHFRFIVSPDDAAELSDLNAFTRDLMSQAEGDLGTKLDWVAVDHWNTGHPHIHIIVRGRADDDQDLVISRDYIREGLRARAGRLVTLELGLRTDADLRRQLTAQIDADRWTPLDRALTRGVGEDGLIDVRPPIARPPDEVQLAKIARLRKLQALGLANEAAPGRWRLSPAAEPTLRALGQRDDVIARMHRALTAQGLERDPARFVTDAESGGGPVLGRLAGRGLDDELAGSAYAIVDGADGRTHHVRLRDLDDATDAPLGALVEVRERDWKGRRSLVLGVRSDLSLQDQVTADGATWLDRQLVGRAPAPLGEGGFADEARAALEARIDHLAGQGLARRDGRRTIFARDLLETLRDRELDAAARRLSAETGLVHRPASADEAVGGVYRQRLNLASGRFAMLDDGLGFTLVPWRPDLERHLGRQVGGVMLPGGGVNWTLAQTRGLGR